MTKLAPREMKLLWMTMVIVILAITYSMSEAKIKEWSGFNETTGDLARRRILANTMLTLRPQVEEELEDFKKSLPVIAMDKKGVGNELLLELERSASQHGIILIRREAEPERHAMDDVYETALACTFEATLDALVRFLHAQQAQGAISNIKVLTIQPASGTNAGGKLRGNFTIDRAYRRSAADTPGHAPAVPAADGSTVASVQP